jgi:hypothetical protein
MVEPFSHTSIPFQRIECLIGKFLLPRPRANREIGCQAGGLLLGSLIDTCSEVDDNPRKSGMKREDGCWDRPPLNDLALTAHLIVRPCCVMRNALY